MSEKNRKTLKNYFKIGRKPSEQAFEDLIDSNLNMIDEGLRKTPTDGLKISQLGQGKLVSLDKKDAESSDWSVRLDENNALTISRENLEALKISPDGQININTNGMILYPAGEHTGSNALDIKGTVRSTVRTGNYPGPDTDKKQIPADGKWHDLVTDLSGCNSFEIVAGAKNEQNRKYALLHAVAMNANNPESIFNTYFKSSNIFIDFFKRKKKIVTHNSYYNMRCDKLKLRWLSPDREDPKTYSLQIRTNCCYGDQVFIKYHVTQLWDDSFFNRFDDIF